MRAAASELVAVSNLFCIFSPLPAVRTHYSSSLFKYSLARTVLFAIKA
jgi:hypothetical protein